MPSVRPLNMETAAAWATFELCCSIDGRQRGERGGVGRGVQFRVNLRRPAVVDRGPAAEHQNRRDERIHHRDIAAAVAQQAIKTECRHGEGPRLSRGASLRETARSSSDNCRHQTTIGFMYF